MRCSNTGHDTDSYDMVVITLQKLALFVISRFDPLSLVYRFILSQDLEMLVLATMGCFMPSVMFSKISHALYRYYLITCDVIKFSPGTKSPTF